MQLYNCKLRLAGNVMHEVRKSDVTAAEVEILRALHGADAVSDIVRTKMDKREHAAERQRLYAVYANPVKCPPETLKKRMETIRGLFGHDRLPLPVELDGDYPGLAAAARRTKVQAEAPAEPELTA